MDTGSALIIASGMVAASTIAVVGKIMVVRMQVQNQRKVLKMLMRGIKMLMASAIDDGGVYNESQPIPVFHDDKDTADSDLANTESTPSDHEAGYETMFDETVAADDVAISDAAHQESE